MKRKVFKSGKSMVISLPHEIMEYLGINAGDAVEFGFGEHEHQVVITPAGAPMSVSSVDVNFARQISEFIEQYRPTLEVLARE